MSQCSQSLSPPFLEPVRLIPVDQRDAGAQPVLDDAGRPILDDRGLPILGEED